NRLLVAFTVAKASSTTPSPPPSVWPGTPPTVPGPPPEVAVAFAATVSLNRTSVLWSTATPPPRPTPPLPPLPWAAPFNPGPPSPPGPPVALFEETVELVRVNVELLRTPTPP